MKKLNLIAILMCFFSLFLCAADAQKSDQTVAKLVVPKELQDKHKLKAHHERLAFSCTDCHSGQGEDPSKFKDIKDKGCLSCHKSKQFVADRLKFMDVAHANPHNSIHDSTQLSCNECHNEHKPSQNMCASCHTDVKSWMKDIK